MADRNDEDDREGLGGIDMNDDVSEGEEEVDSSEEEGDNFSLSGASFDPEAYAEEQRRALRDNADDLDSLNIGADMQVSYLPTDWAEDGNHIGNHKHLLSLTFENDCFRNVAKEDVSKFFQGMSNNLSIEDIFLTEDDRTTDSSPHHQFFGGELFDWLTLFLQHNSNLSSLSIETNSIWRFYSGAFRSFITCLSKFSNLKSFGFGGRSTLEGKAIERLILTLKSCHGQLENLHLTNGIMEESRALSSWLESQECLLKDLYLESVVMGDSDMEMLSESLKRNNVLESLTLVSNDRIGENGWGALAAVLESPISMIRSLTVSKNAFSDDGATRLANALSGQGKLKILDISKTIASQSVWRILFSILQSPSTAIEELYLSKCGICDDIAIILAESLASNKNLAHISFGSSWERNMSFIRTIRARQMTDNVITSAGWNSFTHSLCNKSSIMATFLSNHSLSTIETCNRSLPYELDGILRLNSNDNKFDVARQKIIKYHFSGGNISMQAFFADMKQEILPYAIAWMGKECTNMEDEDDELVQVDGLKLLYNFVRIMPALFDFDAGHSKNEAKRQRVE